MKCFYCEKEIEEGKHSYKCLRNDKKKLIADLHYPDCYVRFTTFYKTEKELNEWRNKKK